MSPVEAVARAIFAHDYPNHAPAVLEFYWEPRREHYTNSARAALTALRDCGVTEGMALARETAEPVLVPGEPPDGVYDYAGPEFRAMLDAALEGN